jgi:hypothetical protein
MYGPDWDGVSKTAAQPFVRFSREYFATLKDDTLRANAPSPTCLEETMKAWVVVEGSNTLSSCWFKASNHGLDGKFPRVCSLSLRDHAQMFFPTTPHHITNSAWSPFPQHEELCDDNQRQALADAITDIFGRLHCLPVIVTLSQQSKGKV